MTKKWIVGVDLGGTTTKIAFIQEDGDILHKWEIETDTTDQGKNILKNIAKSIDEHLEAFNVSKEQVAGIGMGAPGAVDIEKGIIYEAVNLGWEKNYPIADILSKLSNLTVVIDNDANCAALGEMWKGAGNGAKNIACVTLGTGVGGGIIVKGQIVHGAKGAAGEIGHITVVPENGAPCNCGKEGCLETVASATGVVRLAKEAIHAYAEKSILKDEFDQTGKINAKDVFDFAKKGDQLAIEVVEKVAFYLGLSLANVGNTFNPEKMVIGGGVSKAGDTLLNPLKKYFAKFAFPTVVESTDICMATLGNDAGIIGAAWLVNKE